MNLQDVIELGQTLETLNEYNLLWTVEHNNDVQNFIIQSIYYLEELAERMGLNLG